MRNVEFLPSIIYELVVKRFPLFRLERKANALMNKVGVVEYKSYRNWKRSADGARALPLINFTSLERLVSLLFFQKRVKIKGVFKSILTNVSDIAEKDQGFGRAVRVRIRVLMAIGPRSGL